MVWYDTHVTQAFKWSRAAPSAHSGIDLAETNGTPLTAAVSGVIGSADYHAWGGQVDIHFGSQGQAYVLSYLHLSQIAPSIKAGVHITQGQLLGLSGGGDFGAHPTASKYSTGPHLHLELTHGDLAPYTQYSPSRAPTDNYPISAQGLWQNLHDHGLQGDQSALGGTIPLDAAGDPNAPGAQPPLGFDTPASGASAGASAHQALQDLPGFAGIVEAVNNALYIAPYPAIKLQQPNPLNPLAPVNNGALIATTSLGWLANNAMGISFRVLLTMSGVALALFLILAVVRAQATKVVEQAAPLLPLLM